MSTRRALTTLRKTTRCITPRSGSHTNRFYSTRQYSKYISRPILTATWRSAFRSKNKFYYAGSLAGLFFFSTFQCEQAVHHNHQCDGCGMNPIKGPRYECMECENYDLCEKCIQKRRALHDRKHSFREYDLVSQRSPSTSSSSSSNNTGSGGSTFTGRGAGTSGAAVRVPQYDRTGGNQNTDFARNEINRSGSSSNRSADSRETSRSYDQSSRSSDNERFFPKSREYPRGRNSSSSSDGSTSYSSNNPSALNNPYNNYINNNNNNSKNSSGKSVPQENRYQQKHTIPDSDPVVDRAAAEDSHTKKGVLETWRLAGQGDNVSKEEGERFKDTLVTQVGNQKIGGNFMQGGEDKRQDINRKEAYGNIGSAKEEKSKKDKKKQKKEEKRRRKEEGKK